MNYDAAALHCVCESVRVRVLYVLCEDDSDSDASEDSASDNVSPVERSVIAFIVFSH